MSVARDPTAAARSPGRPADPMGKATRRLFMHQMQRSGCTIAEIARHYRYTERHVKRELAEFRRSEGLDDGADKDLLTSGS